MSNGYVISTEKDPGCFIIDPGYRPEKFIDYIKEQALEPLGILLTHCHHDHVGGAQKIRDVFECPVMMTFEDSLMYKGSVDIVIEGGDVLQMGEEEIRVLKTPGHTAGSVCFLCERSSVVFTGDTIFDTDLGRTDLAGGSPEAMRLSCKRIIDRWPDFYTIYPGHDGSATMKQVRLYNLEFNECIGDGE